MIKNIIALEGRVLDKTMTGVGRYVLNLLEAIKDDEISSKFTIYSIKPNKELIKDNFIYSSLNKINFLPFKLISFLWIQIIFPLIILKKNPKIVIYPNNISSFKINSKSKKILILHDLFFKINKGYHDSIYNRYLEFSINRAIKTSNLIICVSQSTIKDLIKYYNPDINKLAVLYPYVEKKFNVCNKEFIEFKTIQTKLCIDKPYILYVGKVETRKNIIGILEICKLVKTKGINFQMVLVGSPGHGYEKIKKRITQSEVEIIYLNYVNEKDLIQLYNFARVFIYPSFYEGFGYPVLEAMQSGCPVVVSNCSALTEVVGCGGIKIEPTDYNKFCEVIVRLFTDEEYRTECINYGLVQSKMFSAERMRKDFKAIVEQYIT